MVKSRLTKADHAREWIAREIRIGNFARGTTLPPEQELADRFGISYMTLRKAVGALVEEGLLERVKGSGTFVRSEIPEQKVQKILGLVLPAWGAPENLDTVMHYSQACEENNWLLKVIYVRSWEDRSIHDLLGNCDALVLTVIQEMASMPSFLCEKLFTSPKPVVVNKGSAEVIGRDSVYYVRDGQMEIPCDRLYELGHRRILLVDQVTRRDGKPVTIHPNMKGFEEIFRRKYPDVEYNTELMAFEIPLYGQPHPVICRAFEERRGELAGYTAVVCPMSFYLAVAAGIRRIGLRVPEDISVLAFGDRLESEYYYPRPTAFSVLLQDQARQTLKLIGWRLQNPDAPPVDVQTAVRFFEGNSFAPAKQLPNVKEKVTK